MTFTVYVAETPKGKYRIIEDGSKWRLDRYAVVWEAVTSTEYSKPNEAAAALAEILGA